MNVDAFETTIEIDDTIIAESGTTIREQIDEYEGGERQKFDLTVTMPGGMTETVLTEMADIPYGETRTYGEIADRVDTAAIAVGQACARNPVPLVIPCHRVVGSDGSLNGYSAADGIATKQRLLDFEAERR